MKNLTRALENPDKNLHFNGLLLTKVYNVWAKKVQRSFVWSYVIFGAKIDAKFGWNLTYGFKNDMKNFSNFHGLKNSNFILESKRAELKQNKNSKQPDGPDAVW